MFNFGTLGYAGTPAQDCPVTLPQAARNACLQERKKRIKLAKLKKQQKAKKNKKGLPGLQSQGLPGVTSGGSQGRWTPLKTFQGAAPSAQNNAVVSGAYEFFRGKGMSFKAAVSKALQSTRVPSRWRSHYTKYLTDKYQGTATPRPQRRRKRPATPRPPRRRFQASVASEVPSVAAQPLSEYAPQAAAVSETPMMSLPVTVDEEVYADDYSVPFYQQPAALLVGAGLLGAAFYFYGKKKG